MMRGLLLIAAIALLTGCANHTSLTGGVSEADMTVHDASRDRDIPIHVYQLRDVSKCRPAAPCPVAIISGGYGSTQYEYSFIANALTERGFLVVSVQHDLPGDAPIPREGNLYELRSPFWARGAANLSFVVSQMTRTYPAFDWQKPVLIGHSNGGDISHWFARANPTAASAVITLDHRRMPIPRTSQPKVLSLRGTDFPADAGVLPSTDEQKQFGIEVTTIPDAKHDEMRDSGPAKVKKAIIERIAAFLDQLSFMQR